MTPAANWGRLPVELRALNQWVIAAPDKTPLSLDAHGNLYAASSTDPTQWLPFDTAADYAYNNGLYIGFVLAETDPFTCIDFDVCDEASQIRKGKPVDPTLWTTDAQYYWFWELAQRLDSYTEVSMNGKGLHIWVRAKLPNNDKGIRAGSMELYSKYRYIVCTGNAVIPQKIKDHQDQIDHLAFNMVASRQQTEYVQLVEVPPIMEDSAIYNMAEGAENGAKFKALWQGNWEQFGHPSQSEADLALMSMLTFYSKSNEQCRRLFRMSALGKREKAAKDNRYLDSTLVTIRSREAKEVKIDVNAMLQADADAKALRAQRQPPVHIPALATGVATAPPPCFALTLAAPAPLNAIEDNVDWPPGIAGKIAWFIYRNAPRPVKEVAIVASLGLLAGICGKAWHIPGSGLNIYLILIALSAIGKESMHSGISVLVNAAAKINPIVSNFVEFSEFASGPALQKTIMNNPCFVNVSGEWGRKLKRLAKDESGDMAMASLRTLMTNLYQKSGPQSIVGGINYSNKDNNVSSVSGVAYSMIGETTPKTFYGALTDTMMEDGFLSRFTMLEYEGDRPALNADQERDPPHNLAATIAELARYSSDLIGRGASVAVTTMGDAAKVLGDFELECDNAIREAAEDESKRQMWNRAALKCMRISALLAVADNPTHPVIAIEHAQWALALIRKDISIMRRKMMEGDVGDDDVSRERKMKSILIDFILGNVGKSYAVDDRMINDSVVPHSYIYLRCSQIGVFRNHKLGANESIRLTVKLLMETGNLKEVDKAQLAKDYSYHGRAFRVLGLNAR